MNVCVRGQFDPVTDDDRVAMRRLANGLTQEPKKVRVSADPEPGWLCAEFTMPTEAQYKALPKIESAARVHLWRRLDWTLSFPPTDAELERAARKNLRAKERRKARRMRHG